MTKSYFSKRPQQFIFDSYSFDAEHWKIFLRYSLDDVVFFEEILSLPKTFNGKSTTNVLKNMPHNILDRALFNLHLVGGVSYYKTFCPQNIVVRSGYLSKEMADFWNKLYTQGLGEFFYKNHIDFRGLVNFPVVENMSDDIRVGTHCETIESSRVFCEKRKKFVSAADSTIRNRVKNQIVLANEDQDKILLPFGGGKDSLVSAELLKQHGFDFDIFILGDHPHIVELAKKIGKNILQVHRTLSPELFRLNGEGAYNGHVPISAYLGFLSVVVSILYGHRTVIFSNERSANEGNVEYLGYTINHQYSKSLEFERDFSKYVHLAVTPDISCFSLLRPLSELKIVEIFSKNPAYFSNFSSCNKNFRIRKASGDAKAAAPLLSQRSRFTWCGKCPKCTSVFTMMAAFVPKDALLRIFQQNYFDDHDLLPIFQELLGKKNFKPFECVGTFDEIRAAFVLAHKMRDYAGSLAMQYFEHAVLPEILNPDQLVHRVFTPSEESLIPTQFQPILHSL